ncbi:MAG: DUF2059 domain-containing protein [Deltaproteobacteria bacterium]|nr:DUF2059 domain-containing protein [Deltaproteobacteria bacterium]
MLRVKSLLLLLVLLAAAACSEQKAPQPLAKPAAPADTEENRQAAAKQYLEAAPPQELLTEMSGRVVKMLPEQSQKPFLEVMNSKSLRESTYNITLKALVKHFTVHELKAMTAFYGSPEGKSIRQKFGDYMGEVMPQVNKEVIAALQQIKSPPEASKESPGQHTESKEPQAQTEPAAPSTPPAQSTPPSAK